MKYPKDSYYRCPNCERHFIGGRALASYKGHCNICDIEIDTEADRTK